MQIKPVSFIMKIVVLIFSGILMSPIGALSADLPVGVITMLLSGQAAGYGNTGSIYGQVKTTSGSNLYGVKITVSGVERTESNSTGYFSVPSIAPADRVVVNFSKEGYVPTTANVRIQPFQVTYIDPVMAPVGTTGTYNGSQLTLSNSGGQITIPAGSLVDSSGNVFSGNATASFTVFDPTNDAERNAFPGDFMGTTAAGAEIPILSYGFFDITVKDAEGNELQLANGNTAGFSIPIPADILATAPATMPLWYFNEENGQWEEQGVVTKVGSNYESSVPHFSIWNNDVGYDRSFVTGRVVCNEVPVRGVRVTFKGVSPRNCWDSGESSTPADGTFRAPVDADSVVDYWVKKDTFESTPVRFTSLSSNGVLDLGDIEFCPAITPVVFTLTWGENPRDLDSHLWTPSGAHIAYYNKVEDGAALDYDDVTSYGPEHISINTMHDGDYYYAVHWYSGTGTWGTSGATVVMTIDGAGSQTLRVPNAGSPDTVGDFWQLWKLTVLNSQVVGVTQQNTFTDSVSHDVMNAMGDVLPVKDAAYLESHK